MTRAIVASIEGEYRRYKSLADEAIAQLDVDQLNARLADSDNSIATIVRHMSGNLHSRFSEFLSSDGEKPWRDRDREFVPGAAAKDELLQSWNEGWRTLFGSLGELGDADLARTVTIRGVPLPVLDA